MSQQFDLEYLNRGLERFREARNIMLAEFKSSRDGRPETPSHLVLYPELQNVATVEFPVGDAAEEIWVRRYTPEVSPKAVVVWIHGGAFVLGDLDMQEADWVSRALCVRGFEVFSLDYRKASPEVHFPAPNEDIRAGWQLAFETATSKSLPIYLGGASAGAAFAASQVKYLLSEALPIPERLALMYPVVHPLLPAPTEEQRLAAESLPERDLFDDQVIAGMHYMYAGSIANMSNPLAFGGVGGVAGFPPTFILNSEHDMLRPSGEFFGQQLSESGVEVLVATEYGSRHGQLDQPGNPFGQKSLARLIAWFEGQSPLLNAEV